MALPGVSISVGLKLIHHGWCFLMLPASDSTCFPADQSAGPAAPPQRSPPPLWIASPIQSDSSGSTRDKNSGSVSLCGLYSLKLFESQLYRLLPVPHVPRHSFLLGGSSNEFLAQLGLMQETLILDETLMPGGELLCGKNTWI